MRLQADNLQISATDLANHLACKHLTQEASTWRLVLVAPQSDRFQTGLGPADLEEEALKELNVPAEVVAVVG